MHLWYLQSQRRFLVADMVGLVVVMVVVVFCCALGSGSSFRGLPLLLQNGLSQGIGTLECVRVPDAERDPCGRRLLWWRWSLGVFFRLVRFGQWCIYSMEPANLQWARGALVFSQQCYVAQWRSECSRRRRAAMYRLGGWWNVFSVLLKGFLRKSANTVRRGGVWLGHGVVLKRI